MVVKKIIYTLEKYDTIDTLKENTVFLAGPIIRGYSNTIKSYREEIIKNLNQLDIDLIVFSPERNPNSQKLNIDTNEYQLWELKALDITKVVLFDLGFEEKYKPGLATRVEFGQFINRQKHVVAYISDVFKYSTKYSENFLVNKDVQKYKNNFNVHHVFNFVEMAEKVKQIFTNPRYNIKYGPFSSTEIYIDNCSDAELAHQIIIAEEKNKKGAIYLYFKELYTEYFRVINSNKYKFHRYHDNYYVYYKWNNLEMPDMVPEYATSICGIHIVIFNENRTKCLLTLEVYDNKEVYRIPGGSVEKGESIIDALSRELEEEIGLKLDKSKLLLLNGYQCRKARFNSINDVHFTLGTIISETTKIHPKNEVKEVLWIPIEDILNKKIKVHDSIYIAVDKFNKNEYIKSEMKGDYFVFHS